MDSSSTEVRQIRWSAAAGTAAPIWFWVTLIALALLHGSIDVSGHQVLRFGFLMYVGFFAYGTLTLAFVWGLRHRLPARRLSTAATAAFTIFACGPLLGTFTEGLEQGPPESWHAWLHFAGLVIVTLVPIFALPLFGAAVWDDRRWRWLGPLSAGWALVVIVVVFLPASPANGYPLWSGPGSMLDLALVGAWQILVSRRLARLAGLPLIGQETGRTPAEENALSERRRPGQGR
jgi:peptidoglycan/LPS O-acetylase OafA/YrhL